MDFFKKKVTFNPKVQVRQGNIDLDSEPINLGIEDGNTENSANLVVSISTGALLFISVLVIAIFATWVAGLVRMGMCGGVHTGFFWATLLLFILVPGPGSIAGFVMAIVALVMLKPGRKVLGMHCPIKKR